MFNLEDLGLTPAEPTAVRPRGRLVPDDDLLVTLRDAERCSGVSLAALLADLGLRATVHLLRDAINQIWGRNPSAMPFAVIIAAAPIDGVDDASALDVMLRARFQKRTADRILELMRRRSLAFFDRYPAWQPGLADQGVKYPEMERRGLQGEFDATGPLKSPFDLATMTFPRSNDDPAA